MKVNQIAPEGKSQNLEIVKEPEEVEPEKVLIKQAHRPGQKRERGRGCDCDQLKFWGCSMI